MPTYLRTGGGDLEHTGRLYCMYVRYVVTRLPSVQPNTRESGVVCIMTGLAQQLYLQYHPVPRSRLGNVGRSWQMLENGGRPTNLYARRKLP